MPGAGRVRRNGAKSPSTEGGPRSRKRDDVVRGAFTVFASDGYVAASIDVIAERAGVSTRTIYNHFTNKERLFQAVIEDSAARVADAQIALMDEHLAGAVDLETALTAFALAWVSPSSNTAEHFRLMRRIQAERAQLPRVAVEAWRRAGPVRVKRRLAVYFSQWASAGWLTIDEPYRAALQFASLVSLEDLRVGVSVPLDGKELRAAIASSVRVFLYGCAAAGLRARTAPVR